jgi:hypothetical protein
MASRFRRVFRPAYGRYFKITPRKWWSRSARNSARLAAAVLDYEMDKKATQAAQAALIGLSIGNRHIPSGSATSRTPESPTDG